MLESHANWIVCYSRQSIKKYVKSNNDLSYASPAVFDNQFNKAIKTGVDKGDFNQPKGKLIFCFVLLLVHLRSRRNQCHRVIMVSADASLTSRTLGPVEAGQEGACCEARA